MEGSNIRRGARRASGIPSQVLWDLNSGRLESATLVESLAVDHSALMRATCPEVPEAQRQRLVPENKLGITRRMSVAAELLLEHGGEGAIGRLSKHPLDTVRGWAAFMIGQLPNLPLAERLERMRALADDPHFGVREWAWLALRPHIGAKLETAVQLLTPWTFAESASVRRFAVEAARPRGVWAQHIAGLKRDPDMGLPLLDPLKADTAVYVQDSVANWINDVAKDRPDWAEALCRRWRTESRSPATERICRRAVRSLSV